MNNSLYTKLRNDTYVIFIDCREITDGDLVCCQIVGWLDSASRVGVKKEQGGNPLSFPHLAD